MNLVIHDLKPCTMVNKGGRGTCQTFLSFLHSFSGFPSLALSLSLSSLDLLVRVLGERGDWQSISESINVPFNGFAEPV